MKFLTKDSDNDGELIVQRCNQEMFCNALVSFVDDLESKSKRPFMEFSAAIKMSTGEPLPDRLIFNLSKGSWANVLFCPFCGGALLSSCYELVGTDKTGVRKTVKIVYESFQSKEDSQ